MSVCGMRAICCVKAANMTVCRLCFQNSVQRFLLPCQQFRGSRPVCQSCIYRTRPVFYCCLYINYRIRGVKKQCHHLFPAKSGIHTAQQHCACRGHRCCSRTSPEYHSSVICCNPCFSRCQQVRCSSSCIRDYRLPHTICCSYR